MNQLTESIDFLGHPFTEDSEELLSLNSKYVFDSQGLFEFERRGKEQFENFRNSDENFYSRTKKNNIQILKAHLENIGSKISLLNSA